MCPSHYKDDCNKNLEWYKSVKDTQGSIEETSFDQMNNIQSYGHYTIVGRGDATMYSIHDAIQLILKAHTGIKLLKKKYGLDELRDLESKLVLITGSEAKNRDGVDLFINVCILCNVLCLCQIKVVFLILYRPYILCVALLRCCLSSSKWAVFTILDGKWLSHVSIA